MRYLVLSLLLVASCGKGEAPCNSKWFDAAGLKICDNDLGVSSDEVELAVDILESDLNSRDIYSDITGLRKTFADNNTEVIFTDKDLAVNCEEVDEWGGISFCEKDVWGVNINWERIYIHFDDCLAWTAFIHELLHSVEHYYLDVQDGSKHDTPEFFVQGWKTVYENSITVEHTANATLRDSLSRCE